MGTIHRTTISIPQELRDEMDAVQEQVNWSAVAALAFWSELARIAMTRKRTMTKEDVVKRLKAEQEKEAAGNKAAGKHDGRRWAEKWASPTELRRLNRVYDGGTGALPENMVSLYEVIDPAGNGSFDDFKETAIGSDASADDAVEDPDYTEGFLDGATDVWEEVKGEL
jgi:hypothetical protein